VRFGAGASGAASLNCQPNQGSAVASSPSGGGDDSLELVAGMQLRLRMAGVTARISDASVQVTSQITPKCILGSNLIADLAQDNYLLDPLAADAVTGAASPAVVRAQGIDSMGIHELLGSTSSLQAIQSRVRSLLSVGGARRMDTSLGMGSNAGSHSSDDRAAFAAAERWAIDADGVLRIPSAAFAAIGAIQRVKFGSSDIGADEEPFPS